MLKKKRYRCAFVIIDFTFFFQIHVRKKEMLEFVQEMYPDFILTINLAVVNYFRMEAVAGIPTILKPLTSVRAIVEVLETMFSYFLIFKVHMCIHHTSQFHDLCSMKSSRVKWRHRPGHPV